MTAPDGTDESELADLPEPEELVGKDEIDEDDEMELTGEDLVDPDPAEAGS